MRTIFVEKKQGASNILDYIAKQFPSVPKSLLHKALRNKDIKVNGKRIHTIMPVAYQDKIDIYMTDAILFQLPQSLTICYQDENILVVVKPQGILSNTEEDSFLPEPTLEELVQKQFPNARICHRLDRNTSGLVIFACQNSSYHAILQAFKHRNIEKEYVAYVADPYFEKKHAILNSYLLKDPKTGYVTVTSDPVLHAKPICTEYDVIQTYPNLGYALLKIKIHTGKTHQIRAQCKAIGHPIIGDSKYGNNQINKQFKKYKQLLFAITYRFHFEEDSPLYYLNDKTIALPDMIYQINLGCDKK